MEGAPPAPGDRVGHPRPINRGAKTERPDPAPASPRREARVHGRARHGASIGSTAFATRRGGRIRGSVASGRKRSSFASRAGSSEPTSSPLKAASPARRPVSPPRPQQPRPPHRQLRLDVRERRRERAGAGEHGLPRAMRRAATRRPRRPDGGITRSPRTTTWARRGRGSERESRSASAATSERGTRTGSTSSTGGLGSTSCRTAPDDVVLPTRCVPRRLPVEPQRLVRPHVVGSADREATGWPAPPRAPGRQAAQVPVVRFAHGSRSHSGFTRQAVRPR